MNIKLGIHQLPKAMKMNKGIVTGILLCCLGNVARSESIKPYALTCIGNSTNFKLNYFVKWGEGEWTRASVSPQKWMWHTWNYNNKGESPELLVRYDADLSQGQTWVVAPLERYASPSRGQPGDCERYGRRYQFNRNEKDLIELTAVD